MSKSSRLIVFFVPHQKLVNGGILSVFSICQTSRLFKDIHHAEAVLSVPPGYESYRKNDLFDNDETVYTFEELVARGAPEALQLHVPEFLSYDICQSLKKYKPYLDKIPELRVNIMTQNILLLQPPHEVANWFQFTPHVTQTTAHNKYASQELADRYFTPIRHLSTFVAAKQYEWTPFEQKEKLIVLSPDETDNKAAIVAALKHDFPDYELVTVQKMRYEAYKKLMSRAKFAITFGEGFDGYYVEAFFTGGITFAVYNDKFFPDKDFATFKNTFASYTEMQKKVVSTMAELAADKQQYERVVKQNLDKINALYDFETYKKNVKQFYLQKYSFVPAPASASQVIGDVIRERDRYVDELNAGIRERDKAITGQSAMIAERDEVIRRLEHERQQMLHSLSWKITKPLRKASSSVRKARR